MPALMNPKKELFARLFATKQGTLSRVEMVKRAGYGENSTNEKYYSAQAARLLSEPAVIARITEIRQENGMPVDDEDIRKDIVHLLYSVVFGDYTKHMMVGSVLSKTGIPRQYAVVKDTDFKDWSLVERQCIQGFDRNTGNPIFIDKMKALDKLKELVVNMKDEKVVEDIQKAYFSAGLMYGLNNDSANLRGFVDDESYLAHKHEDSIDLDEDSIDLNGDYSDLDDEDDFMDFSV